MNLLMQFLGMLAGQIPQLVVWMVGAILALVFWRRDCRGSLLVLLSCLLCLFATVFCDAVYAILPQFFRSGPQQGPFTISLIYRGVSFVRSLVEAAAWVMVLFAAFRRRPAA